MAQQQHECCPICCEDYNKTTKSEITCEFSDCGFTACKSCVRRYLLDIKNDPHCMNCKKMWGQHFLVMNLNRSFVTQEYKNKRKQLLLEKEMSKMPGTMEVVERIREIDTQNIEINKINAEIELLQSQITKLTKTKNEHKMIIHKINHGEQKERKQFIMPCPGEKCRGFLSCQYKCEICKLHTCPKCLVIIGPNKNDPHVCNEDMVKSAELIRKETKPCPSCGTRIYKISGCNQMWCTHCHVAFSWNSGQIDNGLVHNPHFYEYQKNANNGNVLRNPGDIVCGGLCNMYTLRNFIRNTIKDDVDVDMYCENREFDISCLNFSNAPIANREQVYNIIVNNLYTLHRFSGHVSRIVLYDLRETARDGDITEMARVDYILQKKTKEQLSAIVYQKDYKRQKTNEILHIYELLNVALIDFFRKLLNSKLKSVELFESIMDIIRQFVNLKDYCNSQLKTISISYNQAVPTIIYRNNSWDVKNVRFEGYSQEKQNMKKKKDLLAAADE
uniref:RING-type domain-containing protein n=1 Tax=Florenciella sp. virus SA2 TaxID=3240092 RepID=A0AB39JEV4_9VIRU